MRVLVATDGSPSASLAVDLAAGIAWPEGSTIRVVKAIDVGTAVLGGPWPAPGLVEIESVGAELWRAALDLLEEARSRMARPGIEVVVDAIRGRPASAIVESARTVGADLIILGSRGHGTIESMLLGSVSAEVVDHATVPVLVARDPSVGRAVLAWDGSGGARAAVDLLETSPIFAGARVRVVSVAEDEFPWWTGLPIDGSPELQPAYADAATESRRDHVELVRRMADELRQGGIEAEAECREGDAATELLAAARAWKADVIVMGTHGRTGLARLVLGSVARNVLHHSSCSVLIARVPDGSQPGHH